MEQVKKIIFSLIFSLSVLPCLGQGTKGFKYVKNYAPKDYNALYQNWVILQDKRNIIYTANQGGVLEFDGLTWRTIPIFNNFVRSLDIDANGTIYIGGRNELGYLEPDHKGTPKYISLLNHLKKEHRRFAMVYQVLCHSIGVYFRTGEKLFQWRKGKVKTWKPEKKEGEFKAMFKWKGDVYIQEKNVGLKRVKDGKLELISENEIFAKEKIYVAIPYDKDNQRLLIGTRNTGFFIYNGKKTLPFNTEVDNYLREKELYHGIRLYNGDFALATLKGGVLIIDDNGRLKRIFNKNTGLQDDNVKHVFQDFSGNLWLGLHKGISKIVYGSPVTFFDERSGLNGAVKSITRHKGRLLVATDMALYYPEPTSPGEPPLFHHIPGISGKCRDLLSVGDSLLAATAQGVFLVDKTISAQPLVSKTSAFVLTASKKLPGRVWLGTGSGVSVLRQTNGQWGSEQALDNIQEEIRSIVEDDNGNLWLGTLTQGVFKVDFSGNTKDLQPPTVTQYGTAEGLPKGEVYVTRAAGHVVFATPRGIYRLNNEAIVSVVPDKTLGEEYADGSRGIFRLIEDQNKHIWFHSNHENFHAESGNGDYKMNFFSFPGFPLAQVNSIYPDQQEPVVWFGTNEGLICFDKEAKRDYSQSFFALIRKITTQEGKPVYNDLQGDNPLPTILKHSERNLLLYAAAPFYDDESETQYRYFMEGYDSGWSMWSKDTIKDYTNLDAGHYTLHVKAKNIDGIESKEDTFSFRVLPPWYFTWLAFVIYGLAAVLLMYLIVKWRSWRLVQEKQRLEQVIKERTHEINQANTRLQGQNLQLEEQSEKLKDMDKVKSRFFANISHEFRTPLTLIMGPLDKIRSDCRDIGIKKQINVVNRNARRLLKLINQLLDLSRFESGKMKLQAEQRDLVPFLKGLLEPFELAAVQHQLSLVFHTHEESILLYIDPEKLEKIMNNLLSNAVKFTPPGGSIIVTTAIIPAAAKETGTASVSDGHVTIAVRDTGVGIPRDQLPQIFNRFYQVGTTIEHHYKGSGIGLALVAELVELHHGGIMVRSKEEGEDSGTEFILRFPLGKKHLKHEEIVENQSRRKSPDEEEIPEESLLELEAIEASELEVALEKEEETREEVPDKDIVLVVEDNSDLRYYIRNALEPDYTVVEAKDGREGIEKAKSIIPDLIISDIMMPEKDGYELCRDIKSDISTSHIPVILLTAKAADEDMVQGLESGADDYITKPFNTRLLCARVKNLIDLRRQLQVNLRREMVLQPSRMLLSKIDREFLDDLKSVIGKNLSDPDFNVEELSKRLYMSRATVYRKIQALSGETPTDYIRSCRLKRAAQLLRSNYGSVTEVAFEVGFTSRAYFTKCFKEKFHKLPSDYFSTEST